MRGPYIFKPEDAENFARSIGARFFNTSRELFFETCPYCHQSKDKRTFSINLTSGKFHCFRASCNVSGNMLTLAKDFDFSLGQNADEYYRPTRHYRVWKKPEKIEPKEMALAFLESRGISAATAKRYMVTDKDGKMGKVIVFPFVDENGDIQMIKYRNPEPKEGEPKEWSEPNCKPILFGMYQCDPDEKVLIITEGQMDSLSVAEAGYTNAVSVPTGAGGFTWVPYCWNWIEQFERIIVFGDHEKGHITLYAEMLQRWKSKVWCVRPEDYRDCKDANDILRLYGKEQIRKCIQNAAQPPISNVIPLSEVEDVDLSSIEKLGTGITKLDETLSGGLPFGQLVLITGKSGDGKSTLGNQLIVNAIDYGYRVFVYSGELPNFMLRSWIMLQAAGPDNIEAVKKYGSKAQYKVKPEAGELIRQWLEDIAWIYDNNGVPDEDTEQTMLADLLETVIDRCGVRVILLDNLMTALDLEPGTASDKYDRQSEFVKKLTRLAVSHNVLIILVAHKRKMGAGEVNDTVSGSADIVNLASIVMSYERGDAKSKEDASDNIRYLRVTKNRLTGELHKGIKLTFDPCSKRIHEVGSQPTWQYSWEAGIKDKEEILPWET